MEILRHVTVFVHLIAFAILFGAWFVEALGKRRITRIMTLGMTLALVTGLALSAPWGLDGGELPYAKIAVKLGILVVIGAFLGIGSARQRKTDAAPPALFWLIGLLTLLNAGLAVIWR